MAWLKVGDTALTHPKAMRLRGMEDDVVSAERVIGWVMLCSTWSGQHETDCWIAESVGHLASPRAWEHLAAAALKARMLTRSRRDGQRGWLVVIDDGLFHLMSKAELDANRERRRDTRQDGPKIAVLLRDGDQCRYCLKPVNPKDNRGKSGRGREFDHTDPADRSVFVVACTECNGIKGQRTPEQAGMYLLDPPDPDLRHFHPSTLEWFAKRNVDPQRPGTQPDPAPQARPGTQPDPAAAQREPTRAPAAPEREPDRATAAGSTDRPTDHQDRPVGAPADVPPPGRVGSGSGGAGTGGAGTAVPRTRDGPRARGTRGRRGRQPRAP